jgi:peptidoglycan hydrolase-like amidase
MSVSEEEFKKMGFESKDVKRVFSSDLNIYKDGKVVKYGPDGSLIKDKNENVYLLENGKKRKFTSPRLFEYLGYKWENIKEDSNIDFYLSGADMVYPDGTLIVDEDSKMYLIENKQRREISSSNLLKALGYGEEDLIPATKDELGHFPIGKKVVYPDGTLIKVENHPAVYLIEKGQRKEFTSAVLFEKSGYDWNDIINVSKEEIDDYQKNGKVLYPDGLLVKSENSPDVYLLEDGQKRKITSTTLFEKLKYNWDDVVSISSRELSEYSAGKILTYPDGTLIKREGHPAVYKIEKGKRKEFTSLTLFKATKNKWSDVIVLSEEEFSAYDDGGIVKYPEGTLLRQSGSEKVYVVENEKVRWIKTPAEFKEAGYKWSNVIEVSSAEMSLYTNVEKNRGANSNDVGSNSNDASSSGSANSNINGTPNIKIAIYSTSGDDVTVTANGNYSVNYYNSDGTISRTEHKSPSEKTTVKYFNSSSYVKFVPSSREVIMKVLSYSDLSWNKSVDDNEFRGNIEIKYSNVSNKLWIINEVPIEDYVNGVAEALNDSPDEYLKAFGTVVRTYAMYYLKKGGKHPGEPFHLKNSRNGNGNDQIYKGYNFEQRAPKITAANKLTRGYVITYNNQPIAAAYSSDSGGITKSGCEILSKAYCKSDYAYLNGGVKDPVNTEHDQSKISASHGVGMSAIGAYQMALNGNSWQEIVKHYYPGVKIEKYY